MFNKHPVLKIFGGLAALGFVLWELKLFRWLAGGVPWFDFFYERYRDPSWIGAAVRMLARPPPGMTLTVVAISLILVYWTTKPKDRRMSAPAIGMVLCAVAFAGCLFWYLFDRYFGSPAEAASAAPETSTIAVAQPSKQEPEVSRPRPNLPLEIPPMDSALKIARREQLQAGLEDAKNRRREAQGAFEKITEFMQMKPPPKPTLNDPPTAAGYYTFAMNERGMMQGTYISNFRQRLTNLKTINDKLYSDRSFEVFAMPGIEDNPYRVVPGEEAIEDKAQGYEYRKVWYMWQNARHLADRLITEIDNELRGLTRDIQSVPTSPTGKG